jgi:hypothetical protein
MRGEWYSDFSSEMVFFLVLLNFTNTNCLSRKSSFFDPPSPRR